jgi:hypothetical protein
MNSNPPNLKQGKTLRQLYPHLGDFQVEKADENLRQYVAALRVFERLELDTDAWARFEVLTASRRGSRMNHERPEANSTTRS